MRQPTLDAITAPMQPQGQRQACNPKIKDSHGALTRTNQGSLGKGAHGQRRTTSSLQFTEKPNQSEES
jgi:hypothetical protein